MSDALEVVIVEDSASDLEMLRELFDESGRASAVRTFRDGDSALAHLREPGTTLPALMVLDLNLPGLDGRAVLADIKGDAALRHIPVVVLSGSEDEDEAAAAYANLASCYIQKPDQLEAMEKIVDFVCELWLPRR